MRMTKTQLEERLMELGDELLEAEMMDDREKYYELLEEQIRLSAKLHYGNTLRIRISQLVTFASAGAGAFVSCIGKSATERTFASCAPIA